MTFFSRTTKQLLLLISFLPPYWLMGAFRNHLLKFLNEWTWGQAGGNWEADLREGRPATLFSGEMQLTGGARLGRKERVSLASLAWRCRAGWLWGSWFPGHGHVLRGPPCLPSLHPWEGLARRTHRYFCSVLRALVYKTGSRGTIIQQIFIGTCSAKRIRLRGSDL